LLILIVIGFVTRRYTPARHLRILSLVSLWGGAGLRLAGAIRRIQPHSLY
jgi:hypothetical protein